MIAAVFRRNVRSNYSRHNEKVESHGLDSLSCVILKPTPRMSKAHFFRLSNFKALSFRWFV